MATTIKHCKRFFFFTVVGLTLAQGAACQQENGQPPHQAADNSPEERAKLTLSRHLKISAKDVTIENIEQIDWNDMSLGCPQPGRMYGQAIVPGYRVIARHQNQDYNVHLSRHQALICTTPDGILPQPQIER